ncbi:MAG: ABC transporter ATP-binding protein [Fusobacterium sp. JB021]|nr:ABC transporter ATP-binding protein [Fusobacterium sp. JB021]MDP0505824.1 ABC transporter ATP-binding protein [Fusobacterium sp. JB019]
MLLEIKSLEKGFFKKKVLDDFNLEIKKGYIYGLVGPNGSGKSTFMKILAGLVQKTKGEIYFKGEKYNLKTRYNISYQPTEDYFYKWMKVEDAINFYKDFYSDFDKEKALGITEMMQLEFNQKISSLSTGEKVRLKVALALSRNVPLYLLDEPLNGVDPISREKIVEVISGELNQDKTIIISSHLIKEFETILDRVLFLKDGKILLNEDCEELRFERNMSINDLYKEIYD